MKCCFLLTLNLQQKIYASLLMQLESLEEKDAVYVLQIFA